MRVFLFVSLFATAFGTVAFAYEPYPFQRSDGKWGYVNDDHCWVIAPQFEAVWGFSEGLAAVELDGKWGFIDKNGAMIIGPMFDAMYKPHFHNGRAMVTIGYRNYSIDHSGLILLDPTCDLTR